MSYYLTMIDYTIKETIPYDLDVNYKIHKQNTLMFKYEDVIITKCKDG